MKKFEELLEKIRANDVWIKELEKALKTAAATEETLQKQNEQLIKRMIRMVVENYGRVLKPEESLRQLYDTAYLEEITGKPYRQMYEENKAELLAARRKMK